MYSREILDHFRKPRNARAMANADGVGRAINPSCSDVVEFYIKVDAAGLTVIDASFKAQGCVACIAAASVTTELVLGQSLDAALGLGKETVAKALGGVPPAKMACSMISPTALHEAIADYRKRVGA